ncbi:hypothetical protein GQ600_26304 [Phytophthora cactorum]|nr:hypothetical protein GQ600_26304 [Phytophthora cactorum]
MDPEVAEAFVKHEEDVCEARTELFQMLLLDAWRIAMSSQNYITNVVVAIEAEEDIEGFMFAEIRQWIQDMPASIE